MGKVQGTRVGTRIFIHEGHDSKVFTSDFRAAKRLKGSRSGFCSFGLIYRVWIDDRLISFFRRRNGAGVKIEGTTPDMVCSGVPGLQGFGAGFRGVGILWVYLEVHG